MANYTVKTGAGIIVKNGKGYGAGESIDLTDAQYARLKDKVDTKEAQAVEQGEIKAEDLTFDELKSLVDEQDLEVTGTGKNGAIKKADLLNALDQ